MKATRSFRNALHLVVPLAIALVWVTPMSASASGQPDPGFGSAGVVTVAFSGSYSYADDVAIQSDHKLVALGTAHSSFGIVSDFALVRLDANGDVDTSFGDRGRVTTDFGDMYDEGLALAIQADGRIVAAGSSTGRAAIARYLPDGSLDRSFDRDGRLVIDVGVEVRARDLAIQPNGRIVVALDNGTSFSAARLRKNGSLDNSFGLNGVATVDLSPWGELTKTVALDASSRILLGGSVNTGSATQEDWGLARLDRRGELDPTFGSGGLTTTDFARSGPDALEDLVVQADGAIVAAGQSSVEPGTADQSSDVTVARYEPNGILDPDFGVGGSVRTDLGSYFDVGRSVALGADGSILVASDVYADANAQAAVVRYTTDGALDPTFGGGGIAVIDTPSTSDQAFGIAVQPNGKVVIAGVHSTLDENGTSFEFLIARLGGT